EADLIEHKMAALVGRVFGLALGDEDLIDHDQLRDDPVTAILTGKLEARRANGAAGRQIDAEPAGAEPDRTVALPQDQRRRSRGCSSISSPTPTPRRRYRSFLTSMPPTTRCMDITRGASSTAITTTTAICRFTSSAAGICWRPNCGPPRSTP